MVLGKMKDEFAGRQVQEFCGLNAKTYSFDNGEHKAKGVDKASNKKYLTHEDYVKILNEKTDKEIECMKIGSEKFRVTTRKELKTGLTSIDVNMLIFKSNSSNYADKYLNTLITIIYINANKLSINTFFHKGNKALNVN